MAAVVHLMEGLLLPGRSRGPGGCIDLHAEATTGPRSVRAYLPSGALSL